MKIVLRAFGNKLSGVMEIPEDVGQRFRLAMSQPVTYKSVDYKEFPLIEGPLDTICEWEWTGKVFSQNGHEWDGAREYQLVSVEKR